MNNYNPLKITMRCRGESGASVAREVGITKAAISLYIIGKSNPSLEVLGRIVDFLDCDISDVVRYDFEDSNENKIKRFEDEVRMRYVSPPSEYDDFIRALVEAFERGLEA